MMNRIYFFLIISILFVTISSCSNEEPTVIPDQTPSDSVQDTILDPEIQESQDVEIHLLKWEENLDNMWAVLDGKVYCIQKASGNTLMDSIASEIENAVCVYHSRFVFCEDGSFVDLLGSPFERWSYYLYPDIDPVLREGSEWDGTYPVFELIKELNSSCGIRNISRVYGMVQAPYYIYANNGKVYHFEDPASQYDEYDDILTPDGKIYDEKFPETSSWENITDYRSCEDFIIGLTSDGKVLSSGIEFAVENAVKIDIIYLIDQRIPAALTADGKLVLGEIKEDYSDIDGTTADRIEKYYQELRDVLIQAENFTDIVDFTYYDGSDFVILAQKSDGTLIATSNDVYNPEYVSQPE